MIQYRVIVPAELRDLITHLPPTIKQKLHASLRFLETDPLVGKPLERELTGYRSHPSHPYRVVYRVDASRRIVHVVVMGHRRDVYDLLIEQIRRDR